MHETAEPSARPSCTTGPRGTAGPRGTVEPHSHCSTCGAPYGNVAVWPRRCPACGHTAYRNPLPVAVALQPVQDTAGIGLLVITRSIAPARGLDALPGGFVDHREDWRDAVVRELREETRIEAHARDVVLADVLSSRDGHLLIFGLLPVLPVAQLPPDRPTDETHGRHLLREPVELGFPLHTIATRAWFAGHYG
ncbi:NUDIX domain-containing protein [Streptomyces triticagri]|uniref:NUDIX domain-containing protein n=1 Tax=Streptomyces triticagri TaxID=2293568 RepID=A0A372M383_9ACTN|nr:NUDIX domain-containing protein [Streptomyces triticagri]